ncbi:MAG: hypothetical protein QM758_26700 [Armatimonas sp.]
MTNRMSFTKKPGFMPVAALLLAVSGLVGLPRLYTLVTKPQQNFAPKKPVPPEMVKIQEALKAQKHIHISIDKSWDLWKEPKRFAFSGRSKDIPYYGFNGKDYFYFDNNKAYISNTEKDLINYYPSKYLVNTLYSMNFKYWIESGHTITNGTLKADLLEAGLNPQTHIIEFDPGTWLPKKHTVIRNTPPPNSTQETLVYNIDYKPIDAKIYSPRIPSSLETINYNTIRTQEESVLKTPLFTVPIGKQKLDIRRVRIDTLGDIYIDYTGPFPDYPSTQLKRGPSEPVVIISGRPIESTPGKLEVVDSLGHSSIEGKNKFYDLPGTHIPNTYFAKLPTHPLAKYTTLRIRHYGLQEDLRPRTVTLRLQINPLQDEGEPKVYTWTSKPITPSNQLRATTFQLSSDSIINRRIVAWSRQIESGNLPSALVINELADKFIAAPKPFMDWGLLEQLYKMSQSRGQETTALKLAKAGKDYFDKDKNGLKPVLPAWISTELEKQK